MEVTTGPAAARTPGTAAMMDIDQPGTAPVAGTDLAADIDLAAGTGPAADIAHSDSAEDIAAARGIAIGSDTAAAGTVIGLDFVAADTESADTALALDKAWQRLQAGHKRWSSPN